MAVSKVQGIELNKITRVWFGVEWINIKVGSFKEESEGYFFEDLNGYKYNVPSGSGIGVSNIPQIEPS